MVIPTIIRWRLEVGCQTEAKQKLLLPPLEKKSFLTIKQYPGIFYLLILLFIFILFYAMNVLLLYNVGPHTLCLCCTRWYRPLLFNPKAIVSRRALRYVLFELTKNIADAMAVITYILYIYVLFLFFPRHTHTVYCGALHAT